MKKQSKSYYVALYGIMFACIFVAMMLDKLISLPFSSLGLPSMAFCVLLVTFCFCFIRNEWLTAFLSGAFFGLASWIKVFIFPGDIAYLTAIVGADSPLIIPYTLLVYVVPRLFVGIVAFSVYKLFCLLFKNIGDAKVRQKISITIGVLFGLVTNTVLFLSALNFTKEQIGVGTDTLFNIIKLVLYTNIIPEYLISLYFVPIVVIATRRALHLGISAENKEDETDSATPDESEKVLQGDKK